MCSNFQQFALVCEELEVMFENCDPHVVQLENQYLLGSHFASLTSLDRGHSKWNHVSNFFLSLTSGQIKNCKDTD